MSPDELDALRMLDWILGGDAAMLAAVLLFVAVRIFKGRRK